LPDLDVLTRPRERFLAEAKWEAQVLADELGIEISVNHLPPGTSKWVRRDVITPEDWRSARRHEQMAGPSGVRLAAPQRPATRAPACVQAAACAVESP
jgi:hypothetical protein